MLEVENNHLIEKRKLKEQKTLQAKALHLIENSLNNSFLNCFFPPPEGTKPEKV